MAGVLLPFLKWFIGGSGSKSLKLLNFVVRSPWNTIDAIGEVKQPVLFLSGLQDEMVPPFHKKMLYVKAAAHNSQCTFVEFPSGIDGVIQATPSAVPYTPHKIMTRSRTRELGAEVQGLIERIKEQGEPEHEAEQGVGPAGHSHDQPDIFAGEDVRAHSLGDKVMCVLTIHQ